MENLPDNENINVTPAPAEPVENTPEATPSATVSQPQAEAYTPQQPPQYTPAYVPPVYTGYGVPYGTNIEEAISNAENNLYITTKKMMEDIYGNLV